MNIGYTVNKGNITSLKKVCQDVRYIDKGTRRSDDFFDFIRMNLLNDIYVLDISDVGLQLIQLLPILQFLAENKKIIHFLDKRLLGNLSDDRYFHYLLWLSNNEREIMASRTLLGIKESSKRGIKSGRPRIPTSKIEKIQYLADTELRPFREIADICGVSIGTVHKYVRKLPNGTL